MLKNKPPHDVDLLNVNVPVSATADTECRMTRLSRQGYFLNHLENPQPTSRLGDAECRHGFNVETLESDSDILAFTKGFVTVSPMSIDLTSRVNMDSLFAGKVRQRE